MSIPTNYNFNQIANRKSGQRFIVKDEKLTLVKGPLKFLAYLFRHEKHQRDVRDLISREIQKIEVIEDNAQAVQDLFFKTLKPLNKVVFDRRDVTDTIATHLIQVIKNEERLPEEETDFNRAIRKVKLAQRLGLDFSPISEGASGAYFGKDRFGKILLIFKPDDETADSDNSPKMGTRMKRLLQKLFPMIFNKTNIAGDKQHLAEAAAFQVDLFLDLKIVPATYIVEFTSKQFNRKEKKSGSAQLFVPNTVTARRAYNVQKFHIFRELQFKIQHALFGIEDAVTQDQIEKLAVLDFVIGNQDRHFFNWLVNEEQKKAVAIDNGTAFPHKVPRTFLEMRNMYQWRYLPQANHPFQSFTQVLSKEQENTLVDRVKTAYEDKFTEEQELLLRERIAMLGHAISEGWTPRRLAEAGLKNEKPVAV